MKNIILIIMLFTTITFSQIDSAKVYWVGHSLISAKNWSDPDSKNLIEMLEYFAPSQSKSYGYHKHTIPGAPIGWNWGVSASWGQVEPLISPLTNNADPQYGSFNAIVVTEGVNIESSYEYWASSFWARKFFNAAKSANSETRLFLYESWHHYNAGDFQNIYGPQESFNWIEYMKSIRSVWESILEEASDPTKTASVSDYVYQGTGEDPGEGDDILEINIIPTGKVFIAVMERLQENRPEDDWSYSAAAKNGMLEGLDFFANPYLNFPEDLSTTVHGGDLDDIHPSDVLIYLNALTHYSVIYRSNPANLPTTMFVPENIANIFKEVVWEVVSNDPLTGVNNGQTEINLLLKKSKMKSISIKNDRIYISRSDISNKTLEILNVKGRVINRFINNNNKSGIDLSYLKPGIYFARIGSSNVSAVKFVIR